MSQINDALKRAKNAQQKGSPHSGVTPMRPIEPKKEERDYSWVLPVVIIVLIVIAVFCVALFLARHTANSIAAQDSTQQVETVVAPAPLPPPAVIGPGAINTSPPPTTQIQGIVYDPVHPWAIVNGKTVYVGDLVDGKRIVEIGRNSITFAGNGQTNKLFVGQ